MVAISDITEKMNNYELKSIRISNYQGNIPQILREIASLKLFITSRFHANILGLKFNIPIIPICYSSKSSNVLNDINFDRNLIYNFETVNRINYKNIHIPYNSENIITKQFNDLDLFINNKNEIHV